jgi:membrane associated rhomboid family serine protease
MIFPYSTDAPIYHWPIATAGTIVANTLIFLFILMLPEEPQEVVVSWLVLTFGNFNPITWLTCNYMHADIVHLIGNMIFLWVFGLIVEGKIGWWKFLLIYNVTGIIFGMALQILTLPFSEGSALGASAAIFGLMAIVMIWAPANNIHCIYFFGGGLLYRGVGGQFEIASYVFVGVNLILQFLFASYAVAFADHPLAAMTSEILHLTGAAVGAVVGLYMFRNKLVDCEGWDVFSVWAGKHTRSREQLAEDYIKSKEGQQRSQELREVAAEQIRKFVAADEAMAAWAAYKRGLNQFPGFQLPENDLLGLIAVMRKAGKWDETVTLMVNFLRAYPQRDAAVRLALAQLLIEKKSRGRQAYHVLQKIDKSKLDPRHLPLLDRFATQARTMAEDDPYEVAAEDW